MIGPSPDLPAAPNRNTGVGGGAGEEAHVRVLARMALAGALVMVGAACDAPADDGASGSDPAPTTSQEAAATSSTTTSATTNTASTSTPTTTVAPFTEIEVGLEPPAFEEVAFDTDDGVTLRGRFWRGSDVAVLVGHDFGNTTSGAFGQRPDQNGDTIIWLSGALARQGYTVLSPDYRGHGLSDGDFNKREGSTDLRAARQWLVDQGAREIVVAGWVGSGTVAAHLDATDDSVDFSGIVLMFSPPQEIGHDAQAVIADLTTPTFHFGINTGTTARFAKLLSEAAGNSQGVHVFDAVPTGLTFVDVFGPELAGRVVAFVEDVTS